MAGIGIECRISFVQKRGPHVRVVHSKGARPTRSRMDFWRPCEQLLHVIQEIGFSIVGLANIAHLTCDADFAFGDQPYGDELGVSVFGAVQGDRF